MDLMLETFKVTGTEIVYLLMSNINWHMRRVL